MRSMGKVAAVSVVLAVAGLPALFPASGNHGAGPYVTNVVVSPNPVVQGLDVAIHAFAYARYGTNNTSVNVAGAEFFVDPSTPPPGNLVDPPLDASGTPMDAEDGAFDSPYEQVVWLGLATWSVGDHWVCVRAWDTNGDKGDCGWAMFTVNGPTGPLPPVAVISAPPTGSQFSLADLIAFDGSASYDPDGATDPMVGDIVAWAWDFGDGGSASGATATHQYGAQGTYTITLTVTDDEGDTDSGTTTLDIVDRVPPATELVRAVLVGASWGDVLIEWLPNADDGGGESDVVGYDVWRGSSYDAAGGGYGLVASLPPGTTAYADVGAGHGDISPYFYCVIARDAAGQTGPCTMQGGKFARSLAAGKQLISVPFIQDDSAIGTVLQTISWSSARTYVNEAGHGHNWWSNRQDRPWNDLTDVDPTMALWVEVTADGALTVAGLVPTQTALTLDVGWNFVGFPSMAPRNVGAELAGASVQRVEGYANDPPFYLTTMSDSDTFVPGFGFWIHVSEPFVWTVTN